MRFDEVKGYKEEVMVTITMQFSLFMSKKEIDNGEVIPHEMIVTGCVEQLASKNYDESEDVVNG